MQKPSTRNPTKQTTKKTINKKSIIFKLFFVCSSAVSSSFRFVVFFVFKARRPIHVPLGTKVWVGALLHHWSSSWLDFLGALMMIRGKHVHPRKLTWNLKRMVSKRNLLLLGSIFRFPVSFRGCTLKMNEHLRWFFSEPVVFYDLLFFFVFFVSWKLLFRVMNHIETIYDMISWTTKICSTCLELLKVDLKGFPGVT